VHYKQDHFMIEEVKESCVLQVHHKQDHIMVGKVR
jgi:hypothetical protein